jgi:hypothetical protein
VPSGSAGESRGGGRTAAPRNKRRGRAPKEVDEPPEAKAPLRCPAPELGIMPTKKKAWEDCGNAHASVDGAFQIMVACEVTAAANDKQHAAPMAQLTMAQLEHAGLELPQDTTGTAQKMPATYDSGY